MDFFTQEYQSGQPFPSPGDLPEPGLKPRSPTLKRDSLPSEPPGRRQLPNSKTGISCDSSCSFSLYFQQITKRFQISLLHHYEIGVYLSPSSWLFRPSSLLWNYYHGFLVSFLPLLIFSPWCAQIYLYIKQIRPSYPLHKGSFHFPIVMSYLVQTILRPPHCLPLQRPLL